MRFEFEEESKLTKLYNFLSVEWEKHIHPVLHYLAVPSVLAYGLYQNDASFYPTELFKLLFLS
ncbi:hypothetical protein BMR1_02g03350 [Babesia microti strain RI]|uniref:Uncharacterized protein n=1 Tax=Babesia microti (strain RI) TaxID=1133968 RepID=I7I8X0_BABMR|nr:hypothetical protein BMR1_02g03350 [Babesia microti strain RI]CCF73823.1 hypothetical protein BMR1_02g03350 [Babesia microti strain RI]|eukprot:XP_012648432.1 hypothetical protein BMR1_02g03350 [Babesia microti strain RI]